MNTKINKIFEEIKDKKAELKLEYEKMKEKYGFRIEWRKIIWNKDEAAKQKKRRKSAWDTFFSATVFEILSIPFIYAMIIPAVILDIFLFMYQQTAIRLYKIPLAKRSDYIVFDRRQLWYLNWLQKINCIYCSYVNWLFQYWVEVAWRTEKYWCPIKSATKKHWDHNWEKYFADYGDVDWFRDVFHSTQEFKKIKK